jgi:LacI family transcriptional regulator
MPTARKIAIVSPLWSAYVYRLVLGALSYAASNPGFVTRDFRLAHDFQDDAAPNNPLNQLRKWNPDGLLCVLESEPLARLVQFLPESRPVVNMASANPLPGVAVVAGKLAAKIELQIRHLRQQGLRSLACLELEIPPHHGGSRTHFDQIAKPANPEKANLLEVVNPALLEDPYAPVAPVPARLAAWLRALPKPVGVINSSIGGGGYLIRVCHELGLRVPEDVAVVGTDDDDMAIASSPTLTTVLPSAQQIGEEAMRLLDQMMHGKPAPPAPVRFEAMVLRVRESTGLNRSEICDIAAALEYIAQHACHGVSVSQVMKETQHVSYATFHNHFQAATGQTPGEAIQQRQVEEARRLLGTTQLSITTIAEYCGFCDNSSFARHFRALQKMSPSDYRKQAQTKSVKRET